jgi:aryl-alcohol dehydrogenase-like predicted oxidoreductase
VRIRRLGRGGPRVSVVGLGFWEAGGRAWRGPGGGWVRGVVEAALDAGVNFFDTAEVYGWGRSERLLGEALRAVGAGDGVVVASKVGGFRFYRGLVLRGVEGINRRLGRTVDLIQAHWPPPVWVPLCLVVRGLEEAVLRGLAHYYGLSNYPAGLVERALECSRRIEPVSDQVQYSLAYRSPENRLKPLLDEMGLGLIAWSPLAKGALAGATRPSDPAQRGDPVFREASRDERLQEALGRVSERLGLPRATVALAWLVSKGALPIPGTRRPGRVREIALAGEVELPSWAVEELDSASSRYRTRWGGAYRALQWIRLVPCGAQYLAVRLAGGV